MSVHAMSSTSYVRSQAQPRPSGVTVPGSPDARQMSDKELAEQIITAMRALQDAMDSAVLAGLIVEPTFTLVPNRFSEMGVSTESHILNVQIYRKLS